MVKCNNCGVNVSDDLEYCPNCGNNLASSDESQSLSECNVNIRCSNCGAEVNSNNEFCPSCGNKLENEDKNLKCENCGAELHENDLFCKICGSKVSFSKKVIQTKVCSNCGSKIEDNVEFCPECGNNVRTGVKTIHEHDVASSENKINLESIIKTSIMALIVSIIISVIGLFIGFSWVSFILAIILSVGFFAGITDNEVNASISGLFVGFVLGILENPLVEFSYGIFAAVFYRGLFGSQLIVLMILGVIVAYISNRFLKKTIESIIIKFKTIF